MKCNTFCLRHFVAQLSILIVSLFFWSSSQAELILTAPPRETAAQGAKLYGPLANHLTTVLGKTVTYKHPVSWPRYQRDMRADKFDIVFDEPHFMSWRMWKHGHTQLVRLPGKLSFVIVVKSDDKGIKELLDLTYKNICALSPPDLSTLTMIAQFGDTEPANLKTISGGMTGVYNAFKKGECRAAILRDAFYKASLTDEDRVSTKIILESEPVDNQGLTVSTRIDKKLHEKIVISLLEENPGTAPILKRFAPGEDIMIPASSSDYEEYYKLLQGVIIGW